MENSVLLAKIMGPLFSIILIGVLLNLKAYQKVIGDFFKNSALVYLGGVMALLFGLLIIQFHNVWKLDWVIVITILGWLGLIKGAVLVVYPNAMAKLSEKYQNSTNALMLNSIIMLIIGVFLTTMGYLG